MRALRSRNRLLQLATRTNDALTLLIRDSILLRPVLEHDLSQWSLLKGEVCSPAAGEMISEQANRSLLLSDHVHAGYADIVLSARAVTTRSDVATERTTEQTRRERQLMRYNGRRHLPVAGSE
ncbi:hypothetical protein LL965_01595 [Xanthomonas cassavae CFBP 4642]|uniref:Uncharacterized protein n=1 Tax=Xanthomonas cassavae CFBP 4642 TaxID=1219375 RepID=A0ABS8H9I8_9XANT|nr:hypothetical protein [Xanthomonas cassavae]MCC4618836.1 hypothetical protein [Xanthomonas cassavae CFBP 4642]